MEWRISKRVEEQFTAFMSGFNELIPQELVNVFDERELELLIGGVSEIDVYVLYHPPPLTSVLTPWLLIVMTGTATPTTVVMTPMTKSSNGSGNVSAHGPPSASLVCYNSRRARPGSPSTGSRTYKDPTDLDGSRLRRVVTRVNCPRVIPASTECVIYSFFPVVVYGK